MLISCWNERKKKSLRENRIKYKCILMQNNIRNFRSSFPYAAFSFDTIYCFTIIGTLYNEHEFLSKVCIYSKKKYTNNKVE